MFLYQESWQSFRKQGRWLLQIFSVLPIEFFFLQCSLLAPRDHIHLPFWLYFLLRTLETEQLHYWFAVGLASTQLKARI